LGKRTIEKMRGSAPKTPPKDKALWNLFFSEKIAKGNFLTESYSLREKGFL